jgi:hypothetical protein
MSWNVRVWRGLQSTRFTLTRKFAIQRTFNLTACIHVAGHCADYCGQGRVERKDSKDEAKNDEDMSASDTMANPVSPFADPRVRQPKQMYAMHVDPSHTYTHTHTHTHTQRAPTHTLHIHRQLLPHDLLRSRVVSFERGRGSERAARGEREFIRNGIPITRGPMFIIFLFWCPPLFCPLRRSRRPPFESPLPFILVAYV